MVRNWTFGYFGSQRLKKKPPKKSKKRIFATFWWGFTNFYFFWDKYAVGHFLAARKIDIVGEEDDFHPACV